MMSFKDFMFLSEADQRHYLGSTHKDKLLNKILDCIKSNSNSSAYGLRRIDKEYMPKIGADVPFSWDWDIENDCSSDVKLDGASCIGIDITNLMIDLEDMDTSEEKKVIERILDAINQIEKNNYSGELILVAGEFKGYGNDKGEILIDGIRLM